MVRTFVVGDVHGQCSRLSKLLAQIRDGARDGDGLVFLGDYIDRGPDSRGVIDLVLAQIQGEWPGPVTPLKGNHEELMLDSFQRRPRYPPDVWMQNGGLETIASYTGGAPTRKWVQLLPPAHLEFLEGLASWHEDENGIYVHAGIPPGADPAECSEGELLWIRDRFIESDFAWDKVVVFGHTPQHAEYDTPIMDPEKLPWRPLDRPEKIGLDTGVAYGGPLSAVVLPEREFFSVR